MSSDGKEVSSANSRGVQCRFLLLSLVFCLINLPQNAYSESSSPPIGICAMDGCNCTVLPNMWTNVKCVFSSDQEVELREGTIPANVRVVEVSHCRKLWIQSGAFTGGAQLKRVHVSDVQNVVARGQAFHNLTAPNPNFEVSECDTVVLESHAFKNSNGTLSVSIARCRHVRIKANVFFWPLKITIKDVPQLELFTNSFKFATHTHGRHGPATQILFQNVKVHEIPKMAFPSIAMEVRMDNLEAGFIRTEAFTAVGITKIAISNATIRTIETGAFSARTLIRNLEFVDVIVDTIKSQALVAPVTNFTIQYSRVNEMETDAINVVAATVTLNNNEFRTIGKNAITLQQWNNIAIHQNVFGNIADNSICVKILEDPSTHYELSFTENHILSAAAGSLRFATLAKPVSKTTITGNYFAERCSCNLEKWMKGLSGSNESVDWLLASSYCEIDKLLETCFKLPKNRVTMKNVTSTICKEGHGHIHCAEPPAKPVPSLSLPSVGPRDEERRRKGYGDVEMSDPEQLKREKRIILIICGVVGLCVLMAFLMFGVFYVRRRGVCPKLTSGSFPGLASWMSPSTGMAAATSARSISRMSVNEYAGLQPETRVLDIEAPPDDGVDDVYAYTENKSTQTLPEELTEEYLKDLRDRLNDPDNYSEARDMIEHLYDLIKVEESCNNNNNAADDTVNQEVYHDVVQRLRPRGAAQRPSTSVGTRAPSLDKLLPSSVGPRSQIVEYAEPRDSKASDQNHLYAELLGDETVPSTSRLSQPVLATLAERAQHPLPSEVSNTMNEKSSNQKSGVRDPTKSQTRPLSFLKALGESILGTSQKSPQKRPTAPLLCEYAEPSDATAHLYSELSEPQTNTASRNSGKMANRPLPTKPCDLETTPIAKA